MSFISRGISVALRKTGMSWRLRRFIRTKMPSLTKEILAANSPDHTNYRLWVLEHYPDAIEMLKLADRVTALSSRPLFSLVVGVYNTDLNHLRDCIDSIRAQAYPNWELLLVDDASPNAEVREVISEYAASDERIKTVFLGENRGISGARNAGIAAATGEYLGFVDHDDLLWPQALLLVAEALEDGDHDVVYTDEDKITEDRFDHKLPFFKPGWSPDLLLSINYICHFLVIRKSLVDEVGGFRPEFDGAEDWDLLLRVTAQTNRIHHVDDICYSWRIHELSTASGSDVKPYVAAAQLAAVKAAVTAAGRPDAEVLAQSGTDIKLIRYPVLGEPLVSIVIPSKNMLQVLRCCVDSIYANTDYRNYEIVVVDTGSTEEAVHSWYAKTAEKHNNFKVVDFPEQPFSFSRSVNAGAAASSGEILVFLNNDTEVITEDWLTLMIGEAQRPEVGSVGALLFYPDGKTIQHAGIGVGLGYTAANILSGMTIGRHMGPEQWLTVATRRNYLAVTGACLAMRREVFDEVGGFSERYRITYNDVDLGCRLHEAGYLNVLNPKVKLLHHESISLGHPDEDRRDNAEKKAMDEQLVTDWVKYMRHDPYFNLNLDRSSAWYPRLPQGKKQFCVLDQFTHLPIISETDASVKQVSPE